MVPFDGEAGPNTPTLDFTGAVLQSSQAAEEAMSREQVPAAHRQKVRTYFEILSNSSN